jgi:hypothetical protein
MEESLKGPRKLIYAAIFVILTAGFSAASDIYVAQNAAGGNTGTDCADAHAVSWFNSSSNWGSSFGQIGAGTTVHLCGTISSALTAQGSGTSANPVTIFFETGANISMPALPTSGALVLSGLSWVVVDGNNQAGIIQSTNNGDASGGYANQVCSMAIAAQGSSNITVRELQILNIYVKSDTSVSAAGGCNGVGPPAAVYYQTAGNITVDHVVMTYCASCVTGGIQAGATVTVSNSTCANFDHCLGMGIASNSAVVLGPVYFFNNEVHDMKAWDTAANTFHHDGVHLWGYCSDGSSYCAGTYWNNIYIYNNHFYGVTGTQFGDWIFNEANVQNEWAFNNFSDTTEEESGNEGPGPFYAQGINMHYWNNTFLGSGTASSANLNQLSGSGMTSQNNVSCNGNLIGISATNPYSGATTIISALSNDFYMNGNSNAFGWKGNSLSFGQFSTWKADSGETAYASSASCTINSSGTLQSGSIAIGAGTNLYSTCKGQPNPGLGALCYDAAGNPRSPSAAWDAGAFAYNSTASPSPPTGLAAVVQ